MGLDHSGASSTPESAQEESKQGLTRSLSSSLRSKKLDAEVIIIGGGPAGSVLGAYLGRAGVDHFIIDKAHHPRAHVGESLSYHATEILDEIGFLPIMQHERFIVKRGISWTVWHDEAQIDMRFSEIGDSYYGFQVDRSRFDDLLLKHAREQEIGRAHV